MIESLDVCQELIGVAERKGWSTLHEMGLTDGKAPDVVVFEYHQPLVAGMQITIPIACSSANSSLIAMEADMTLSKLGSSLCHLSIRSSASSEWGRSLVNNREFQMVMEVAVAGFLDHLVQALTSVARKERLTAG